jgi:hypothetical protein
MSSILPSTSVSTRFSTLVRPGAFLRRVLLADAATSAAVGACMAGAAGPLQRLTGLPASVLVGAGLALFPYAAYLLWLATRPAVPRAAVWAPIVLNVLWAIDCAVLAFAAGIAPSTLGLAFLAVQAGTVLVFAELEVVGLRRCAIVAG